MTESSPPRGRPRAADPEATRRALMEAGERLFSAKGFERTTIGEIAAEAGVTKGLVRYYFGDKAALYSAIIDSVASAVLADLEARLPSAPAAEDALHDFIGLFCHAIISRPSFPRMIVRDQLDGDLLARPGPAMSLRRFMETTRSYYERGRAAGLYRELDVHSLHLSIVGAAVFFTVTMRYRDEVLSRDSLAEIDLRSDAFVAQLQSVLMAGVKKRESDFD